MLLIDSKSFDFDGSKQNKKVYQYVFDKAEIKICFLQILCIVIIHNVSEKCLLNELGQFA